MKKYVGEVENFNPLLVEEYVNTLLHADEVERALLVLDNLPALYRDNTPANLKKLRCDIIKARITPRGYLDSNYDAEVSVESALSNFEVNPRFKLIEDDVKAYNEKGITPHIVDCGPGEYIIPIALKEKGHKFTYWPLAMDQKAKAVAMPLIESVVAGGIANIFCALEIIEHLPCPLDLATECLAECGGWPEMIHLSTPLYTYDGRIKEWNKPGGLPHLRAYTIPEFYMEASRIFPGYQWTIFPSTIISLKGVRLDLVTKPNQGEIKNGT